MHYYTLIPILFGAICLSMFIRRQLNSTQPMLQLRVFKNPIFTVSTILVIITYIILMSGKILIPIYVQSIRGFSALTSGIVLLPGSLLVALLNPITEKHPGGSFATHGSISPHWGIKKEDKKLQDGSKKNVPLLPLASHPF
jgi:hypothetical protein